MGVIFGACVKIKSESTKNKIIFGEKHPSKRHFSIFVGSFLPKISLKKSPAGRQKGGGGIFGLFAPISKTALFAEKGGIFGGGGGFSAWAWNHLNPSEVTVQRNKLPTKFGHLDDAIFTQAHQGTTNQ